MSLAWAVAEYLHDREEVRAKTLFATHYHELTELALTHPRIKNAHVTVKEWKDEIVFLRKIAPGPSDQSYGIHVAKLAGIPGPVVVRAREILFNLEKGELDEAGRPRLALSETGKPDPSQRPSFSRTTGSLQAFREIREALVGLRSLAAHAARGLESIRPDGRENPSGVFLFFLVVVLVVILFLVVVFVVVVEILFVEFLVVVVRRVAVLFLALLDADFEFVLVLVPAERVGRRSRCRRAPGNRPRSGRRRTWNGRSAGCRRFRGFRPSS